MNADEQRAFERLQRTVDRKDAQMTELQEELEKVTAERDEAMTSHRSLLTELWEGVRAHGLVAPAKGRDGERLIHAYCGGIARLKIAAEDKDAELSRLRDENARLTRELHEAKSDLAEADRLSVESDAAINKSLEVAERDRDAAIAARNALRSFVAGDFVHLHRGIAELGEAVVSYCAICCEKGEEGVEPVHAHDCVLALAPSRDGKEE